MNTEQKNFDYSKIRIKVNNWQEKCIAIKILQFLTGCLNEEIFSYTYETKSSLYNYIGLDNIDNKKISAYCAFDNKKVVDFVDIYKLFIEHEFKKLVSPKFEVELNNEHRAEITKEGIKVGCQNFSFDKFEELYGKIQEFKEHINKQ